MFRVELEKHLSPMRRNGEIADWHDRKIGAGTVWKNSIDKNLKEADLILLLVSADFLASSYCYENEMKQAMKRHKEKRARVIPIILRVCDWSNTPFGALQALPKDGKPLTTWSDRDEGYHDIVRGIQETAREFVSSSHKHRRIPIIGVGPLVAIGLSILLIVSAVFVWFKVLPLMGRNAQNVPEAQSNTAPQTAEPTLITGFVLDSAGKGIDRALVRIENMATANPALTSSNGKFILKNFPGKPGDFIWLVFTKEGYKEERHEYQINGEQKQITLYKTNENSSLTSTHDSILMFAR